MTKKAESAGCPAVTTEDLSVIARQKGVFTAPPEVMPTRKVPDGPLLGNGDLGVAISGVLEQRKRFGMAPGGTNTCAPVPVTSCPERHRFWIAKNGFWKSKLGYPNTHPCPIGGIDINIPALIGGEYHVEQILETAEVVHTLKTVHEVEDPTPFTRAGATIRFRSWVPATENLLIIELSVEGEPPDEIPWSRNNLVGVDVTLWPMTGNEAETATGNLQDGYWTVRRFADTTATIAIDRTPLKWKSEAAVAMRLFNHRKPGLTWFRMDGWPADRFVLSPTHPVIIVASIVTSEESETPLEDARRRVESMTPERVEQLRAEHRGWWRDFWAKSFVEIGDPKIEKYYYGSNYLMACCSRNIPFPPSLFGNWTTADGPSWQGDYHLNYNHEAPWWGVYASNHPELADPYDTPILEFMPAGMNNARQYLGVRGVYYNVGVSPKGFDPGIAPEGKAPPEHGDQLFLGQKSNAAFCTSNMFMRFYLTYDLDYARKVYPFLSEVANFWEDYLKWEPFDPAADRPKGWENRKGRYIISGDSLGERGDGIGDTNNTLSLGLVKMLFKGMLDVSAELGVDADRRGKWQYILDHLSDFPTTVVDGVHWLRNAEAGPSAREAGPNRGGSRVSFTGLVWPSCVLGLSSDPATLEMLRNDARGWPESDWINHYNGFSQTFTQAVRVGHDPRDVLAKLHKQIDVAGFPNLMIFGGGGGIENCSGVPATINEMLLQSHEGVMRLFPVWPKDRPARFGRLRTAGAFLVSGELRDGLVQPVLVESEKGRECVLQNPWPGQTALLHRNGRAAEKLAGQLLRFRTGAGERIVVHRST